MNEFEDLAKYTVQHPTPSEALLRAPHKIIVLSREERQEIAKILRRGLKLDISLASWQKASFLYVVDDFVSRGYPEDQRERNVLKMLIEDYVLP